MFKSKKENAKQIKITDTTLRDAHQSLWATRLRTEDILPIASKIDEIGYHSVEVWGGATFDVCLRYLNEDPWERLSQVKKYFKKTPLQMLLRGQNIVGYKHYPDDLLEAFIIKSIERGVNIFRVFDALNDVQNMEKAISILKREKVHVQGDICYTRSPIHTIKDFVKCAKRQEDLGVDSMCIKDMAGILTPYTAYDLVKALKKNLKIPIQLHCHSSSGMAATAYLKGIEAGVDVIDCAVAPLALYTSQPAVETLIAILRNTDHSPNLNIEPLKEVSEYFEVLSEKRQLQRNKQSLIDVSVITHQIPGGMASNLIVQLEEQSALSKLEDVLLEIPRVREDLGWPPLVTPTSQIVGTQAVFNVLSAQRYKIIPREVKDYVMGYYGKPPGTITDAIKKIILGQEQEINCRPADLLKPIMERAETELKRQDLLQKKEDIITYALFPEPSLNFFKWRKDPLKYTATKNMITQKEKGVFAEIKDLAGLINGKNIEEIEWEKEGKKIKVKQELFTPAANLFSPVQKKETVGTTIQILEEQKNNNYEKITSPMVGRFYRQLSPKNTPLDKKNDLLEKGEIICIIEAMRLRNEIEVKKRCRIVNAFVQNGDPVEYGQPLFLIEPL